jgi:hypothetical protein
MHCYVDLNDHRHPARLRFHILQQPLTQLLGDSGTYIQEVKLHEANVAGGYPTCMEL